MAKVSMVLNGKTVSAEVEDRTLLSGYIREAQGLTGHACGLRHVAVRRLRGACDGKAVKSCTLLAAQADGAEVTTVEGSASGDALHPVQAAFREHHGLQCGFCTPGMIMSAVDMIKRHGPVTWTRRRSATSWKATSAAAPAITTSSRRSRRRPTRWPG
jgi:carbon-monoxide dehydrogenase small subunit